MHFRILLVLMMTVIACSVELKTRVYERPIAVRGPSVLDKAPFRNPCPPGEKYNYYTKQCHIVWYILFYPFFCEISS